jgi:predicted amidophosphoribosyltransferase
MSNIKLRCHECGEKFEYSGNMKLICPDCALKQDEEFISVREFVKKHPGVNIKNVIEATGVPFEKIMGYVRDGTIEIKE